MQQTHRAHPSPGIHENPLQILLWQNMAWVILLEFTVYIAVGQCHIRACRSKYASLGFEKSILILYFHKYFMHTTTHYSNPRHEQSALIKTFKDNSSVHTPVDFTFHPCNFMEINFGRKIKFSENKCTAFIFRRKCYL